MEQVKELLTEQQVAEILQCSVAKLRNDRHLSRGLPYLKFEHHVRYRRSAIEKYLSDAEVVPE